MKNRLIKKLSKFYQVGEDILSPDNCVLISTRKDKVSVKVEGMGTDVFIDRFEIQKTGRLKLVSQVRPKGVDAEPLFLPETL